MQAIVTAHANMIHIYTISGIININFVFTLECMFCCCELKYMSKKYKIVCLKLNSVSCIAKAG